MDKTALRSKSAGVFLSIVSVVAGFLTVACLSILTDFVFEWLNISPSAANSDEYQA
jgi:hypothetical protein